MAFRWQPLTQGLFPKVCAFLGAGVFAAGSVLVYAIPPKGHEDPLPKPTVALPLPKASPEVPEKPSPKPKTSSTPKPKVTDKPSAKPKQRSTPPVARPSSRPRDVQPSSPGSVSPRPVKPPPPPKPTPAEPTKRPTPIPTTKPAPQPSVTHGTLQAQVINLINQKRASLGLNTLASSSDLSDQCQEWSGRMAAQRVLYHSDMVFGGEIIASGATTPQRAVELWLNSPPHREIMLSPRYTQIGSGHVDTYWTVQFR